MRKQRVWAPCSAMGPEWGISYLWACFSPCQMTSGIKMPPPTKPHSGTSIHVSLTILWARPGYAKIINKTSVGFSAFHPPQVIASRHCDRERLGERSCFYPLNGIELTFAIHSCIWALVSLQHMDLHSGCTVEPLGSLNQNLIGTGCFWDLGWS